MRTSASMMKREQVDSHKSYFQNFCLSYYYLVMDGTTDEVTDKNKLAAFCMAHGVVWRWCRLHR